ncbi:uncharacterized protein BKA78DRAFT_312133 [Phyllosticta capitalensis]|uniref:uncharacterized protein n=1 Tax=Phyllosticta capitalensis TaxID=121624 RepID=UPI003131F074
MTVVQLLMFATIFLKPTDPLSMLHLVSKHESAIPAPDFHHAQSAPFKANERPSRADCTYKVYPLVLGSIRTPRSSSCGAFPASMLTSDFSLCRVSQISSFAQHDEA